ncbi:hypothetical protein Gogos_015112, partial [Gossypium gossypioides]|nr:hypothetical protein [Gossypium gossypioides]
FERVIEVELAALSLDGGEEDAWQITLGEGKKMLELASSLVMDGSSWTFNNHLLVYHRLQLREDPLCVPLRFVDYWIQVHDLSPDLMSEGMAKQFRAFLGTYINYDAKSISSGVVGYLRRWTRIDI